MKNFHIDVFFFFEDENLNTALVMAPPLGRSHFGPMRGTGKNSHLHFTSKQNLNFTPDDESSDEENSIECMSSNEINITKRREIKSEIQNEFLENVMFL
jgi:hypothetical protein